MERFVGKNALVTGAGSGIGRATAQRLAAEGAWVACVDINGETAAATAAGIVESGGAAASFVCDVADVQAVDAMVAAVVEACGDLHIVCNIAGIGHFAPSHEENPAEFDRIMAVNAYGTYWVCRATLMHIKKTKGVIINTASTAGRMGQPYSAAYGMSKGAVVSLTKSLAWEYIAEQMRINAVAPGGVKTPLSFEQFRIDAPYIEKKLVARMMTHIPMCDPEEVAGLFAYIASDEARYMTGAVVSFDGALT